MSRAPINTLHAARILLSGIGHKRRQLQHWAMPEQIFDLNRFMRDFALARELRHEHAPPLQTSHFAPGSSDSAGSEPPRAPVTESR
jgi:disulfide bond formation protein DsbB